MLKQAIIDAEALKEVALKNAEAAVVEKYSRQIKEAVDNLLEQGEEDELTIDTMEEPAPEASGIDDQLPLAATDGENLCPCPEEEETIELDFDDLQNIMKALDSDEEEAKMAGPTPDEVLPDEDEEELEVSPIAEQTEDFSETVAKALEEDEDEIVEIAIEEDEDEIVELALEEESDNDDSKVKEEDKKNIETLEEAVAFSHDKTSTLLKENGSLSQTNSKVIKENKVLKEKQGKILDENKDLKKLIGKLSNTLESVNLSNAKLIYTNQILGSNSLNERQKNKIVEAITDADSVETAKAVFETLQSAVGGSSRGEPKSLSEVVSSSRVSMFRRKEKQASSNPHTERMKKLAGI
tara:strand:- start:2420 stop:3478 length:1059 start_codon:yes stop_codon:yes gene_type:complete